MRTLILLFVLAAATATATEIYRWVDADGQAHYSDQWQPGAERIQVQESPAYSPPPAAAPAGRVAAAAAPRSAYQELEIASPAQEQVLWNIGSQLPVSIRLEPALQSGHELRLFLDGQQQDLPAGSLAVTLSEVYRGMHTLRAEVVSAAGESLITSPTRTFMVRQTSMLNPAPAVPPVTPPQPAAP